ncbi:hypothetical protein EVAR_27727_1 [Eumeta japonica]|uniref:Uncharacterized protein n=1 Tax=Eumeta variegata TaxID=151549 RepID=A0A4C1WQI5_EUMVA|nr:hypothetical protein EVAR_27727_1 [Eumeta japonica]
MTGRSAPAPAAAPGGARRARAGGADQYAPQRRSRDPTSLITETPTGAISYPGFRRNPERGCRPLSSRARTNPGHLGAPRRANEPVTAQNTRDETGRIRVLDTTLPRRANGEPVSLAAHARDQSSFETFIIN